MVLEPYIVFLNTTYLVNKIKHIKMKKITFLTVVFAVLFACSSSEENNIDSTGQEPTVVKKEEVKKDYDYYVKRIGNDKEWMVKIEEKAKELNISVDSSLSISARKWVEKNNPKEEVKKDYSYYVKRISNDKDWMVQIEQKAKKLNISIDSCLSMTAQKWVNKNNPNYELEKQIEKIKNNIEWLSSVEKQALERGITLDSMLYRTAIFTIKNRNKN